MKWKLNYGVIALIWRAGCIIRSQFLNDIKKAYDKTEISNLLFDGFSLGKSQQQNPHGEAVSEAADGIPFPCITNGLSFFDGYGRKHSLPI